MPGSGAIYYPPSTGGGATAFTALSDTFSSFSGKSKKTVRVNTGETALEAFQDVLGDFVDVREYYAAGVVTSTTLSAQLNAGSDQAQLTDASSFLVNHGIAIPGAGAAGAELVTTVTAKNGNTVTLAVGASTTVNTGVAVYHDDTTALSNAIASGYHLYSPGKYNITSGLTMATAGQGWIGPAFADPHGRKTAIVYLRRNNIDGIYLNANDTFVAGFCVRLDGSLSGGTGGSAAVLVGPASAPEISRASVFNMALFSTSVGLKVRMINGGGYYNVIPSLHSLYGLYVSVPVPYGGNNFSHIKTAASTAGVYIDSADYNQYNMISAVNAPIGIHIKTTGAMVAHQIFTNVYVDNVPASGYAIKVEKVSGSVFDLSFTGGNVNGWSGSGISVGQGVEAVSFTDISIPYCTGYGFEIAGSDVSIDNCRVRGSWTATATYPGIKLYATANGTRILNSKSTKGTVGIEIDAGAAYTTMKGNDFRGNTTAATFGTSVKATLEASNNQGVLDYETSVASAPDKIGQWALVSNVWYRAAGTSAAGDWKALN